MSDPDLNTLRRIIGEQQGRAVRSRRRRVPRPHAPRLDSAEDVFKVLLCAALTVVGSLAALGLGQLAGFWIGDHAASRGREWGLTGALGFQVDDLPGIYYVDHAVYVERRLLVWCVVVSVLVALTYRPAAAVVPALLGGLAPRAWWAHVPTTATPGWAARVIDVPETWFPHASPWLVAAALLVVAGTATAWAARAQAV